MSTTKKFDLVSDIAFVATETDHDIAISTAAGTYFGKLLPDNPDETYDGIKTFLEFRKNLSHTSDGDEPLEVILLVDVTLVTSSNQKITMPFVYLFIDQIIGVSFAKIQD
ncbi:hypothetical protein PP210_gp33 [Streptococcus phage CHPC663]|uniref:Uncharacterized protein n=1 Tax=Streptococcus phage CHPC663 TaxID=2365039 RepID=A0A3G8F6P8_9CAUD|nr:hypothetical protein [Streptococcus thermophilus]YP_010645823.1 hypothetical protein PP210_gp33 [Streptococcus phage CHPC663]AZF90481.1 hypothetical protein CHPC663_0033 [Streptococcus phage CHPC663]PJH77877.1 hypothetical protein CV715_02760 [Streptococcus thermophilus]PJH84763.1 hypothetical protein CV712_03255 [Streptococcus thermophilus]